MKKIYSLTVGLVLCLTSYGQNHIGTPKQKLKAPKSVVERNTASLEAGKTSNTGTFYIDYDEAEFQLYGGIPSTTPPSASYRRFIWDVNYYYTVADSSTRYFTVAFDSLYSYANNSTYTVAANEVITIDSVFIAAGHEKNSASTVNDTIRFLFTNTTGVTNFPGTSVYTSTTVVTNSNLSPSNDYGDVVTIGQRVGYTLPAGSFKFACRLEYRAPKQDTLAMMAGFYDAGGPCGTGSMRAQRSYYAPNSYRLISEYGAYGLLPQAGGGDIYYDCNQNNQLDANDGANFTQNVSMWVKVTISTTTALKELEEKGVSLGQNMPNPFKGESTVKYQLAKDAKSAVFTVTDVTGRIISTENVATSTGTHTVKLSSYAAGVYYYSLNVDGNLSTKKMIVE